MANVPVARILDTARIQLPGALDGTLRLELFNTLKAFFERSDCWRECICVPVSPGHPLYELPTHDLASVVRLLWLEGVRPCPTTDPLAHGPPKRGFLTRTGNYAHLRVGEYPSSAESWHAHVSFSVIDPTDHEGMPTIPDWIIERYFTYLTNGLVSRMAMHPGKPYSNRDLAVFHGRNFNTGVNLAKTEADGGYTRDAQNWSFPQTFRTRSQRAWR